MSEQALETRVRMAVDEVTARLPLRHPEAPRLEPAPRARRAHRGRMAVGLGLAAALMAASLVVVLGSTGGRRAAPHHPAGTQGPAPAHTAAAVFLRAARHVSAGAAPGPGQYLYESATQTEVRDQSLGSRSWTVQLAHTDQVWFDATGGGRHATTADTVSFPTAADGAAWEAAGSPDVGTTGASSGTLTGTSGLPLSTGATSSPQAAAMAGAMAAATTAAGAGLHELPYEAVANLPTDPVSLGRYVADRFEGGVQTPATTFLLAPSLLEEAPSVAQRRAIFELLAALPGIDLVGHVTTPATHVNGTAVSMSTAGTSTSHSTITVDPTTGRAVELATTGFDGSPATLVGPWHGVGTYLPPAHVLSATVRDVTVFSPAQVVASPTTIPAAGT